MTRKILIAVFIVLLVAGALAGIKVLQIKKLGAMSASFAPAPETISSAVVHEEDWQDTLTAIGSVTAVQGVIVNPELAGTVREIAFDSGTVVAKGDLLIRLDTSSEEAQLRSLEAQVEWSRVTLQRERALREQNMVSQSDLDSADAAMKQSQANADAMRTTIEKKTIRAPFAGRLGIRQVNLGQFLDAGKPIVSLQSLAPIHADFSLPQQELSRLSTGMRVRMRIDAYPDHKFEGALTAITPDLDPGTRSVGLQATFDNADQLLRPGMFAQVEVLLPQSKKVLVIPLTSILSAPYGDSVYIIESESSQNGKSKTTVRQQFVRVGAARGDFLIVESGLKSGDRIVSSGLFKLRNGMAVVENNSVAPKSADAPRPSDS